MAKRVLIILRRLNIGGIQTQTSLLAGEFLRRGCSVTVLVQKKSHSSTPEVTMPAGAEVYCRDFDRESKLNPFCFFSRVAAMPLLYLLSGRIGRYLVPGIFISRLTERFIENLEKEKGRFDLILIRGEGAIEPLYRLRHRNLWGVVEGVVPDFGRNCFTRHFARLLFGGKNIVCVSEGEALSLGAMFRRTGAVPARLETILNFINPDYVKERSLEKIEGLPEPGYLVTVGRLSGIKNQGLAIRALAYLPESVRLVLVGEGCCRAELEGLAESLGVRSRCIFTGNLPNPYPYIRNAAMLVHTSKYEAFGMVIAEALALGKPVAVTEAPGGMRNILKGPLADSIVPADERSLAERIRKVLESGEKPDTSVLSDFSADNTAGKFLELSE